MTPEALTLIMDLVAEAIRVEPIVAAELQKILTKPDATPADWMAAKAQVMQASYKSLVPHSQLP
jgi:hypothetical protein